MADETPIQVFYTENTQPYNVIDITEVTIPFYVEITDQAHDSDLIEIEDLPIPAVACYIENSKVFNITMDSSGRDGKDGLPGKDGISLPGKDGESITFETLTPEQLALLQQPATNAAADLYEIITQLQQQRDWFFLDYDGNIGTNYNLYSTKGISAYGVGVDGGGGTGGGLIQNVYGYRHLGATYDDAILTDTFNAHTINQINDRLIAVELSNPNTNWGTLTNGYRALTINGITYSLAEDSHKHAGVYEPALSNPSTSGYLLSSTTAGVKSWIAPYSLPTASASELGGVKIGTNVTISNGVISVHNPLTIEIANGNGLSLSNQELSLELATTSSHGALSSTDKTYIDLLKTFFEWDADNSAIKAKYDFYSVGEVSAFEAGTNNSSGGGLIQTVHGIRGLSATYLDDNLAETFNAAAIKKIYEDVVNLQNGSLVNYSLTGTGNAITGITKNGNSLNFVKGLNFSVTGHTHSFDDINELPTTLSGYGITDGVTTTSFNEHVNDFNTHVNSDAHLTPTQENILSHLKIVDNKLQADIDFYSTGEVSAFGPGTGSGGGGGGSMVVWETELVGAVPLTVEGVTKTLSLASHTHLKSDITDFAHAHTLSDIPSLQDALNSKLKTSIFTAHTANETDVKHLTEAQLSSLIALASYWKLDNDDNLYTERNVYSTLSVSAYGLGPTGGSSGGGSFVTWGLESDGSVSLIVEGTPKILSLAQHSHNYLSTETDPTVPSHVKGITRTNISDWDTAADNTHTHSNYSLLEDFSQSDSDVLNHFSVVDGKIKVDTDFYSTGEISAYGLGDEGESGGNFDRLDKWGDYDLAKAEWALSALLGKDLDTRIIALEGGSATTVTITGAGNAITAISKSGNTITATKGLTFSEVGHTHTKANITDFPTSMPASDVYAWAKESVKPTYVWSEIGNKPTTLSGYGITDATQRAGTGGTANSILSQDTRSVDEIPNTDRARGMWLDFKSSSTIGLIGLGQGTYSGLLTILPYSDGSGNSTAGGRIALSNGNLFTQKANATDYANWNKLAFITDNVASATKLQTARTIWGQSFDGTGNVSGAITGATTGVFSSTVQATTAILTNLTANYLPKHTAAGLVNSSISDNGSRIDVTNSVYISKSSGEARLYINSENVNSHGRIAVFAGAANRFGMVNYGYEGNQVWQTGYCGSYGNGGFYVYSTKGAGYGLLIDSISGNTGIGKTNPSAKLDVNGDIYSSVGVKSPKIDLGNDWDLRASGAELHFFYKGVKKGAFTKDGFYSTGEVAAYTA